MEVYHASMVRVERPDVYHSRKFLDFGQVFYVMTLEAKYSRIISEMSQMYRISLEKAMDMFYQSDTMQLYWTGGY